MKKLAIGLLVTMVGIATVGLAIAPIMTQAVSAATASTGSLATDDFAVGSSSSSTKGPSGTSGGDIAVCPNFISIGGTCSESAP
jgi:hypothetical protein